MRAIVVVAVGAHLSRHTSPAHTQWARLVQGSRVMPITTADNLFSLSATNCSAYKSHKLGFLWRPLRISRSLIKKILIPNCTPCVSPAPDITILGPFRIHVCVCVFQHRGQARYHRKSVCRVEKETCAANSRDMRSLICARA